MKILLFGAGRSALFFVEYILHHSTTFNWKLSIADFNFNNIDEKLKQHPNLSLVQSDINDVAKRETLITAHDMVVSLLPAHLHILIAKDCLTFNKPFANASYVTDELRSLEPELLKKNLLFAGELGLDPGIDHMSAMETIHTLQAKGAHITSFTSYTGGLIAPESDDNPWHYKISWNPRNIILAGQGIAQFKKEGRVVYVPYHQLFRNTELLNIAPYGKYEGYPNRDSLHYEELYGLGGIETLLRGTIRANGFCVAWNILIQCGYTNDTIKIDTDRFTLKEITRAFIQDEYDSLTSGKIEKLLGIKVSPKSVETLRWLRLDSNVLLNKGMLTPAQVLEYWLIDKWRLADDDKDMVIMQHKYQYTLDGIKYSMTSTLHDIGEDPHHTAMSKLVGLPLAIYVKNYLTGNIKGAGFKIPVTADFYTPILHELSSLGVKFRHVTRKK